MFIISEIAPQFGTDLEVAEQMILQSKLSGASAAKVQLYPANLFSSNPDQYLIDRELSFDGFQRLVEYGNRIGLPVFSTAFTDETLDWCIEVNQSYYKVASRQHGENPELVDRILSLNKPTFVSIPNTLDPNSVKRVSHAVYLYCVAQYPTLLEDMTVPEKFVDVFDGLSDHSLGISAALLASTRGCRYLEKHFTLNHALQRSNEKAHLGAMDAQQLKQIKDLSMEFELLLA